jgi:hypothetical protein
MKYLTISTAWLFVAIFLGTNLEAGYKLSHVIYLNFLNYLQIGLGVVVSAIGSVLKIRYELITT